MSGTAPIKDAAGESLLWWRHPFFRLRWKQWHTNWRKLSSSAGAHDLGGITYVLSQLAQANCDPEVALRLAFLEASQKPTTKSELAGDNKRQQRIKRRLIQARNHLWKAMALRRELASQHDLPKSDPSQRRVTRKVDQARNHIANASLELEQALSNLSLIFIKPTDVESLKAMADVADAQSIVSLRILAQMCDHEIEVLNWPRAIELPPGHELFTLMSYITACSGEPHFALATDLLDKVYQTYDTIRSPASDPPTQEAIEKQVQRFRKLKVRYIVLIDLIEESTARRAKSGELRRELLACFPDQ